MRFAFIRAVLAENDQLNVAQTCRLFEVTRQGYYAYLKSLSSPKLIKDAELALEVAEIHDESRGTYGSPRVHAEMKRRGHRVSKRRIEQTMRGHGLVGAKKRRTKVTTRSNPSTRSPRTSSVATSRRRRRTSAGSRTSRTSPRTKAGPTSRPSSTSTRVASSAGRSPPRWRPTSHWKLSTRRS